MDYGHAEPRRGTKCWGKSPFGYFWGSFPKVTRRKGGTIGSRYPNNGYVHRQAAIAGKPAPTLTVFTTPKSQAKKNRLIRPVWDSLQPMQAYT